MASYVYHQFWESETGKMENTEAIYGNGRQIVTDIPRILTAEYPFVELHDLRYGWCDMRFGTIKIPSISYITDPLYDAISMFSDFFSDGHGEMSVDHEGDITDIAIDAVDDEVYGLMARISISTHCGIRSVSDTANYCAAVVSAYGLVASLIDDIDGWSNWSYCETESERRDAIRMYVEKARDMLDLARTAIESCMENDMFEESVLSYVNGSIDTAKGIIDSISID